MPITFNTSLYAKNKNGDYKKVGETNVVLKMLSIICSDRFIQRKKGTL